MSNFLRSVGFIFFIVIGAIAMGVPALAQTGGSLASGGVLDTIVVSSSRTSEAIREVTSNVTVVSEEEIRNSSAANLGELLAQQGFQISGYHGGIRLTIRGLAQTNNEINTRVLILLNGRRIITTAMDLTGMANIERLEIIRGPAALQYGPSAMGGVVNVITRKGDADFKAGAEVGFGSFNLNKEKLYLSGMFGDFDFSLGYSRVDQDDYKVGLGWVLQNSSPGEANNTNLVLGYTFNDRHRIGLDVYSLFINGQECPGYDVSYYNPKPIILNGPNDYNSHDREIWNTALSYEGGLESEKLTWSFMGSMGRNIDHHFRNRTDPLIFYTVKSFTGLVTYKSQFFDVTTGVDYVKYYSYSRTAAETSMADLGGFLSSKVFLLERNLILSVGGRYDSYTSDNISYGSSSRTTNFVPSVGLAYIPVEWFKVRANYAQGFAMPLPEYVAGSSTYLPSPDLKPENSKTYEFGVDLSFDFLNASLTYFQTIWNNKMMSGTVPGTINPDTGNPWYRYYNLQGAEVAGFELAISPDFGMVFDKDWSLKPHVNITYMTKRLNKDHSGGTQSVERLGFETLRDVPRISASFGIVFSHPELNLTTSVNARYVNGTVGGNWGQGDPGGLYFKYGSGPIYDFMVEKRIFDFGEKGHLNLRGELNNAFDRYDLAYLGYPRAGRNFYLGVSYEY
jgi:vitamin B12 transporter